MTRLPENPFAGLPAALVDELLSSTERVARGICASAAEVERRFDELRSLLGGKGLISTVSAGDGGDVPPSCGIDCFSSGERMLGSGIFLCAAFAAEGLPPPSGAKHWEEPRYEMFYDAEASPDEVSGLLYPLACGMEVELAVTAPHPVVFLKGSFRDKFVSIMESLQAAVKSRDTKTGGEFVSRLGAAMRAFERISAGGEAGKLFVGISGDDGRSEFTALLGLPGNYNQTLLMSLILSPGEYAGPVPMEDGDLLRVKKIPIKDGKFASVRDSIAEGFGRFRAIYYKPCTGAPAIRMEVHASVAEDPAALEALLGLVTYQCSNGGLKVPYPLYITGKMSGKLGGALRSARRTLMSRIAAVHGGDAGEILSLLISEDKTTGDRDG